MKSLQTSLPDRCEWAYL